MYNENTGNRTLKERIKRTHVNELMTTKQVAQFLQVHEVSVRRWSRAGVLKSYKIGGRGDKRFQLSDVLKFLEEINDPETN